MAGVYSAADRPIPTHVWRGISPYLARTLNPGCLPGLDNTPGGLPAELRSIVGHALLFLVLMRVILSSLALRCPGWHGPPGWPWQGMILYTPLNPRSQRGLPLSALWCHHGCHSQPLNCQSKTLIEVSTRAPSFLAARACPREIKGGKTQLAVVNVHCQLTHTPASLCSVTQMLDTFVTMAHGSCHLLSSSTSLAWKDSVLRTASTLLLGGQTRRLWSGRGGRTVGSRAAGESRELAPPVSAAASCGIEQPELSLHNP